MSKNSYLGGSTIHYPGTWVSEEVFPFDENETSINAPKTESSRFRFNGLSNYSAQIVALKSRVALLKLESFECDSFCNLHEDQYIEKVERFYLWAIVQLLIGNSDPITGFYSRALGWKGKRIRRVEKSLHFSRRFLGQLHRNCLPAVMIVPDVNCNTGCKLQIKAEGTVYIDAKHAIEFSEMLAKRVGL